MVLYVRVCVRGRMRECVYMRECARMRKRERVRVRVRMQERVRVCALACMCVKHICDYYGVNEELDKNSLQYGGLISNL